MYPMLTLVLPIVVFSIREKGNLARVLSGEGVQTIVKN